MQAPDSMGSQAVGPVADDRSERDWAQAETFAVPPGAKGRWCLVHTATADKGRNVRHMLAFRNAGGDSIGARPYFRRVRPAPDSLYRTITYIPAGAETYQLYLFSPDPAISAAPLHIRPVSRAASALLLLWSRPSAIPRLLRLLASGQLRRFRTMLMLLAGSVTRPSDYEEWRELFDTWPVAPPAAAGSGATVSALVFHRDPANPAPLHATTQALARQGLPVQHRVLTGSDSASWHDAAAALPGEYIAILQAGEELPPHASWFAGFELARLGRPELAYADEDRIGPDGTRSHPVFKPAPGPVMMMSGTQSTGTWFIRRDILLACADLPDPGWAERLRLAIWLHRHEAGGDGSVRIPVILTHRRDDTEQAPPAALAETVNAHLVRTALPFSVAPARPLQLRGTPGPRLPVSILIPSTLRSPLVLRCILSVLTATLHPELELVVGIAQPGPLDPVQRAAAARIEADPRARVMHLPAASFNFSVVCNAMAAATRNPAILLLNDDVSVTEPGWLDEMAAYLADPAIGIVGAKLLYPDGTVQHGGVMIGLAGLCDHVNRGLPGTQPGYASRAVIAQELSAVTAACLLVSRSVYEAVGGLDEAYPSAFNDVDFCLRVREAGHGVIYAPAATLTHHEMLTYGSHYSGDRAAYEAEEINRMRRRWAGLVVNDPFHNPNLDLASGCEWQLAFPPRRPRQFQL